METLPLTQTWLDALQASGFRLTAPRRAIVALMADSPRALGPADVYQQARAAYPRLGLVTVYRTLETLEQLGLVERVHLPDGCHRYLRAAQGHQHFLLCTSCGLVCTFAGDDLARLTSRVASESGFTINDHWLQLFGLCPECDAAETTLHKH